jgi:hypothetical protein
MASILSRRGTQLVEGTHEEYAGDCCNSDQTARYAADDASQLLRPTNLQLNNLGLHVDPTAVGKAQMLWCCTTWGTAGGVRHDEEPGNNALYDFIARNCETHGLVYRDRGQLVGHGRAVESELTYSGLVSHCALLTTSLCSLESRLQFRLRSAEGIALCKQACRKPNAHASRLCMYGPRQLAERPEGCDRGRRS